MNLNKIFITIILASVLLSSCKEEKYFPKPFGYHRIDFPKQTSYKQYNNPSCPFTYEYPNYSGIIKKKNCSHDLYFPKFKATLNITYVHLGKSTKNNFKSHSEYSRKLSYEHRIKADNIEEIVIANDSNKVYGIAYNLEGNVASNYQFFLSDSTTHFFRGALYFQTSPNIDSIKPVLNHIKQDIEHLIHSFSWK